MKKWTMLLMCLLLAAMLASCAKVDSSNSFQSGAGESAQTAGVSNGEAAATDEPVATDAPMQETESDGFNG